jgi:hypothetical protein
LARRLALLLKDRANRTCADCPAKRPRWCSTSLGVFLCADCAAAHRTLGPDVSTVRPLHASSGDDDDDGGGGAGGGAGCRGGPWRSADVETMEAWGNARAAAVYEATAPADHPGRPLLAGDDGHPPSAAARQRLRWAKDKYKLLKFLPPPDAFPESLSDARPTRLLQTAVAAESTAAEKIATEQAARTVLEAFAREADEARAAAVVAEGAAAERAAAEAVAEAVAAAEAKAAATEAEAAATEAKAAATEAEVAAEAAALAAREAYSAEAAVPEAPWYAPGTRVAVKDDAAEPWSCGTVRAWPLVRQDGWDEDFEWTFVQPLVASQDAPEAESDAMDTIATLPLALPAGRGLPRLLPVPCASCGSAGVAGAAWCAHCGAEPAVKRGSEVAAAMGLGAVPEGDESGEQEDEAGIEGNQELREDSGDEERSEGDYFDHDGVVVLAAVETARLWPASPSASEEENEDEDEDEEQEEEEEEEVEAEEEEEEEEEASASESSVSGAAEGGDAARWSWTALANTDAFSGENALVVPLLGVKASRALAQRRGFGGFAIARKTTYFRRRGGAELFAACAPKPGTELHVLRLDAAATRPVLQVHVIGCAGLRTAGARDARFAGGLCASVALFRSASRGPEPMASPPAGPALSAFTGSNRRASIAAPGAAVPSLAPALRTMGASVFLAAATAPTPSPATPFPLFEEALRVDGVSVGDLLVVAVLLSPASDGQANHQLPALAAFARFVPLDNAGFGNGRHWRHELALELTEADGSAGGVVQLLARWM